MKYLEVIYNYGLTKTAKRARFMQNLLSKTVIMTMPLLFEKSEIER